jgi:hypothetical protein
MLPFVAVCGDVLARRRGPVLVDSLAEVPEKALNRA